jgi:hypothetical protein
VSEVEFKSSVGAELSPGCAIADERAALAAELSGASLPIEKFVVDALADSRRTASSCDEIARAELAGAPWWLWWNVLSMDAPMVAVAWALVFTKSDGHAAVSARAEDFRTRMLPDRARAFGPPLRQRHVFHQIYARGIASVAAVIGAFTAILVLTRVGEMVLRVALPVGLILVLYMAWVHLGRGRVMARLPKEVAVGGVFAAGVALPTWSRLAERRWEFFLLAVLFAAVCALNCVAIEEWESLRERDSSAGGRPLPAKSFGFGSGRFAVALAICAALLAPVIRLRGEFSAIGAAIAVSAVLILILDLTRERISADALRVLVDVALLAPALVVLAFR